MSSEGLESTSIMGEIELGAAAEATVQAYKQLAADPTKRLALALDSTCVSFLAYVIAEGAGSLVQNAVDTIELLSQSPDCRSPISNTFGVLEALQEMADDARYCEEIRDQAAGLFTCLQYSRHIKLSSQADSPEDDLDASSKAFKEELRVNLVKHGNNNDSRTTEEKVPEAQANPLKSENSFLGPSNPKAKTVTLYIKNMNSPKQRKQVEEELIKIRGLISIVFDLSHSRVTCRIKKDLSIDKLAAAIARTEHYEAQQVLSGTDGEETIVSIGGANSNITSPVDDLPEYLPEEDSPIKDATSAMAPSGSLRETASSLLSAAANLLTKSFYW